MIWLCLLIAYLVGAIPFGLLLGRRIGGTDVRYAGSGNVGAANVFRTTRPGVGLTVMALDICKGGAVVLFAAGLGADEMLRAATGAAVVVGHAFPLWLRFHGGKGVATACGVFAMLAPYVATVAVGLFLVTVWMSRYVSLGSIVASLVLPVLILLTDAPQSTVVCAVGVATLILYRHLPNLARLQAGTERRFVLRQPM